MGDRPLGAKHVLTVHPMAVTLMAVFTFIGFALGMLAATVADERPLPPPVPSVCAEYVERLNAAQAHDDDARATRITVRATEAGCFHTN